MAGAAAPALSPCPARGYDHKFFWIDPCNLTRVGYNRGMKDETKETILCFTLGALYPVTMLVCIAIGKIFG